MTYTTYKTKHIVGLNPHKLEGELISLVIEDDIYFFKVTDVMSSVIEFSEYFKHESIRNQNGSIEKELFNITYGKSKSQMETWQYAKSFTEFKINTEKESYKFEIKGVGDTAVKLNLYISFKEIDEAGTDLLKKLKEKIFEIYQSDVDNNKGKLDDLKRKDDEEEAKRKKIRKEREEWEKKMKEKYKDIEHLL